MLRLFSNFPPRAQRYSNQKILSYFARGGHLQVNGWLSPFTLSLIKVIADFQIRNNIHGNIAEIGVYQGRFFIALCLLMQRHDDAVVIDVFDLQEFNIDQSGIGDYQKFICNIDNMLGTGQNVKIIKKDSLNVTVEEVHSQFSNNRLVRLFSVDGCHTVEHTINDLRLAQDTICPGGVIILDDYENEEWPGVAQGFNEFINDSKKVKPFALFYNKLYLTTKSHCQLYIDSLVTDSSQWVDISGNKVIRPLIGPPEKYFASSFKYFIDFSKTDSRSFLEEGWYNTEEWGVWSNGELPAKIVLRNNENFSTQKVYCIHVIFHAFVADRQTKTNVDIIINNELLQTITFPYGTDYKIFKYTSPHPLLKRSLSITFETDNTKSPLELGLSRDQRILGVGIHCIFCD